MTQTTGPSGEYEFAGLAAGNYIVDVAGPVDFDLTTANDPLAVALAQSEDFDGADFGFQPVRRRLEIYGLCRTCQDAGVELTNEGLICPIETV